MKHIFTLTCIMALLNFCSRSHYVSGNIESGDNEKPEGTVTSYEYSYSGTMAYPIHFYTLKVLEDGTVQLGYSHDDNDIHLVRVPEEALKKIAEIAEEYSLHNLKGSYRPKMEVLDGYGWHIYIRYENGSISSGGTNAWPKKELSQGIHCINNYLDSLFNAATPQDSLGVAHHHDW
ncbi:MAG: hypothetical protein IJK74_01545 [Bacteroidales bacterium]|nr:hypothetical protein [Bacteroidales bacterium]